MSNTDAFSAHRARVQEALTSAAPPPAAVVLDEAGVVLSWDAGAERLFCRPAAETVGRTLDAWITPLPAPLCPDDGIPACRVLTVQGRYSAGTTFPLEMTLSRVSLAGQNVCAATLRRMRPEVPLQKAHPDGEEDNYRLLFEFSPQPMWVYDVETLRFLAVNQTALLKYGYTRATFLAMTLADIRSPEEIPARRKTIANGPHPAGNSSVWRHRRADGTLIWAEVTSHAIRYEDRAARLVVATDITAALEAERALRESEERLRAVVNSAPLILFAFDAEGVFTLFEGQALEAVGQKQGEAVGHSIFQRYADRPDIVREARRALEGEAGRSHFVFPNVELDVRYTPVKDERGQVTSIIGVATDISERIRIEQELRDARQDLEKRVQERTTDLEVVNDYLYYEVIEREEAEDALRESEARFRTIAEATPVAVTITREADGTFLFANAHFRRIVGLPPSTAVSDQTAMDYLAERTDRDRLLETLASQDTIRNYETRLRRGDGTMIWVSGSFRRMLMGGERVVFAAYDDVSERKLAEQALLLAEENLLRSHGELTAAYDATIEGWSHALDLRDHETEGHARRVTEATLRLARIMQVDESEMVHLRRGALLHDIGKMGIPDEILLKPGPLTQSEWSVMRRHPQYAYDMLSPIKFLRPALDIPWCHHERWNGSGYPHGLAGEDIPLPARIFSVVDVWDALRSDRPYRQGWDADRVRNHISDLSGQHFDPHVVDTFLQMDLSEF
jgi:PAS domain S-box-containing protein